GMVVRGGQGHDSMAEANLFGALAASGQKNLRRRGVRILLEKMMFDQPHVIDPDFVGQFDLIQRLLEAVVLGIRSPRAGQLMFVEDPKLHSFLRRPPRLAASTEAE